MNDLDVSGRKYAGTASALAYPPAVWLFLMNGYQVSRIETEFVVQIRGVLIDRSALFRAFSLGRRHFCTSINLIVVVLRVTAKLVKVTEIVLVWWILRIAVTGGSIGPIASLGILILRQMHLELVITVLSLERFVLCPRRNLRGECNVIFFYREGERAYISNFIY